MTNTIFFSNSRNLERPGLIIGTLQYLNQIFQGGEKVWKNFQEKPEIQIFNRFKNTVSFISRLKSCMEKKVRFFVQRSLGYNGGFHLHLHLRYFQSSIFISISICR